MSESEDSGPGRREVAHRVFAAEFDDSEFSYSESDEERAPNYVVTPTGARVNRLFVVGVLTELEQVNDEVLRARIVDPTGPFVVYAGQYQPEALAFLEAATPPLFVAITGKARTFEPEDGDRVFTSIRPESISEVDAETRDRWVVQAAEQTLDRVGVLASAKRSGLSGDQLRAALAEAGVDESAAAGAALALEYYGTTGDYLQAVRDLARNAAAVVAAERDEAGTLSVSPGDGGDEPLASLASLELAAPEPESAASEPVDAGPDTDATESSEPVETATESSESVETATESSESVEPATETTVSAESDASGSVESTETQTVDDAAESTGAADAEPAASTDETADSGPADATTSTESAESTTAAEPSSEPESTDVADDSDTLGDFDAGGSDEADDVEDFDAEFELDEDEREEIEQEYGTDFQSGTEVDEPGAADIDTPDPEELAEMEAEADEPATGGTDATAEAGATDDAGASETAAGGEDATADDPPEDVDLEDAVMDVMTELNDGSGADREAVRSAVADRYGATAEEVEDAIQDALMGGRCYEPEDGKLTPI